MTETLFWVIYNSSKPILTKNNNFQPLIAASFDVRLLCPIIKQ
jgi:hypothetical protein